MNSVGYTLCTHTYRVCARVRGPRDPVYAANARGTFSVTVCPARARARAHAHRHTGTGGQASVYKYIQPLSNGRTPIKEKRAGRSRARRAIFRQLEKEEEEEEEEEEEGRNSAALRGRTRARREWIIPRADQRSGRNGRNAGRPYLSPEDTRKLPRRANVCGRSSGGEMAKLNSRIRARVRAARRDARWTHLDQCAHSTNTCTRPRDRVRGARGWVGNTLDGISWVALDPPVPAHNRDPRATYRSQCRS